LPRSGLSGSLPEGSWVQATHTPFCGWWVTSCPGCREHGRPRLGETPRLDPAVPSDAANEPQTGTQIGSSAQPPDGSASRVALSPSCSSEARFSTSNGTLGTTISNTVPLGP
jgi:hypothetical protein